ncbi:MAG: helix-turn-helix domain-containing protein [Elusimicrobiota bacterium]
MGKATYVPLPHRQALNKTLLFSKSAPDAATHPPADYLRALRGSLRMSQVQLARRAGVAKSHLVAIEKGRVSPSVETLRKIFDALFCDLLIVPKARKKPTEALAEREIERKREPRYWEKRGPWD